MDVFRLTEPLSFAMREKLHAYKGCAVAIGNFDGVHKGHQELINVCNSYGEKSVVITFSPHPEEVFNNCDSFFKIFSDAQNYNRFKLFGVDAVIVIPFNKKTLNLSAEEFLKKYIVSSINPIAIVVGEDFKFAKNREGDINFLSQHQKKYNYELKPVSKVSLDGVIVSSSVIREFLRGGDIKSVNRFLGGPSFSIEGVVSKGEQLGQKIGYPTVNIESIAVDLKYGVYKTRTIVSGKEYKSISNFGKKPTISDDSKPSLETHILNFSVNIYGQSVSIYFDDFIREEKRFLNLDELQLQIAKDVEWATTKV